MSTEMNDGIGFDGSGATRCNNHDDSLVSDPGRIACEKYSGDTRAVDHFIRLLNGAQERATPKLTTATVNGSDDTSQSVQRSAGWNDTTVRPRIDPGVSNHGLRTSKLTGETVAGHESPSQLAVGSTVTGEHTTGTSFITKPPTEDASRDGNTLVMAGYLHGRGFQLDGASDERSSSRAHVEPASIASLFSAESLAMSSEPAPTPSDAAALTERTEIVELLEQMCSNLYVSGTSESRESRILLAMDAALAGAAVELIRDGAFLRARLHARNEVALQLMSAQREQLHAVLEQASQLYVSVDVVENESHGHGRAD